MGWDHVTTAKPSQAPKVPTDYAYNAVMMMMIGRGDVVKEKENWAKGEGALRNGG